MNNKTLILILAVSILVMVLLGGYYFWLKQPLGSKTALTNQRLTAQTQTYKGFTRAQELVSANRSLLAQFRVQVSYVGTLTQLQPGKSWTLEQAGKTLTINHESDGKIIYQRSTGKDNPTQPIGEEDIKIGDKIHINTFIDPSSGRVSVNVITIIQQ